MASEQTPRDIIAEPLSPRDGLADVILADLDAAGFAIVRKPTGDAIEAALYAYAQVIDDLDHRTYRKAMAAALAAAAAADGRTPECDGLCVTASDIGIAVGGVAYPHPGCPAHAPDETCECGSPDRCLSPTHGQVTHAAALEIRHRQNPNDPRAADGRTPDDASQISDGYHTFAELYHYRALYNAAAFNAWAREGIHHVHKSWRHSDGEECFGGGWFIVVATLPTGQISNHYPAEHWDLFRVTDYPTAVEWDGHSPAEAADRLAAALALKDGGE